MHCYEDPQFTFLNWQKAVRDQLTHRSYASWVLEQYQVRELNIPTHSLAVFEHEEDDLMYATEWDTPEREGCWRKQVEHGQTKVGYQEWLLLHVSIFNASHG